MPSSPEVDPVARLRSFVTCLEDEGPRYLRREGKKVCEEVVAIAIQGAELTKRGLPKDDDLLFLLAAFALAFVNAVHNLTEGLVDEEVLGKAS